MSKLTDGVKIGGVVPLMNQVVGNKADNRKMGFWAMSSVPSREVDLSFLDTFAFIFDGLLDPIGLVNTAVSSYIS